MPHTIKSSYMPPPGRPGPSIAVRVIAGVILILVAVQLSGALFTLMRAQKYIDQAGMSRAESALAVISTMHLNMMTHRTSMGDDDAVTRSFDATLATLSHQSRDVRVWMVKSPATARWQGRRALPMPEPAQDGLDRAAIETGREMRRVSLDSVRIVRPVVLGQGPAADARCFACHASGADAARPGDVLGAYSVAASLAEARAGWRRDFLNQLCWVLLMAAIGVVAMALWLQRGLLDPLRAVERETQRIAGGDFDDPVAHIATTQEFRRIGNALEYLRLSRVQKRALAQYNAFLATHDPMTALPNRGAFVDQLTRMLGDAEDRLLADGSRPLVLCVLIDLVRFKAVNDRLGREAGDALLGELARTLRQALGADVLLARLHGDEFAAAGLVADAAATAALLARIDAALAAPVVAGEAEMRIDARLGYALAPEDGLGAEQLLGNADLALRRAKGDPHLVHARYHAETDESARLRVSLIEDLSHAVARGEISVHYQAQHDTMTGAVVGYEALARWQHPTRGNISPALFIPLAEETGLIDAIGTFVLREACQLAASAPTPVRVAVNVSAVQLCQPRFDRLVHQILVDTGLSPARLELELTETALITHRDRALYAMRRLKALGVQIAVDDFGVGYSSLEAINLFPIDKIKIDRSFVSTFDTEPKGRMLLKAIMTIGESLQVPVLAEGVETASQLAFLRSVGCAQVQGYLLDRPCERHALPVGEAAASASGLPAVA